MSSVMNNQRLIGCPADEINSLVNRIYRYSHYYSDKDLNEFIENEVNIKARNAIYKYSIKECVNIIMFKGDILDAIKKNKDVVFDFSNSKTYHRQLAYPYVKEWISMKVHEKFYLIRAKINKEEHCCSICLDVITSSTLKMTSCKHAFHKECLTKWGKNICPNCRRNI